MILEKQISMCAKSLGQLRSGEPSSSTKENSPVVAHLANIEDSLDLLDKAIIWSENAFERVLDMPSNPGHQPVKEEEPVAPTWLEQRLRDINFKIQSHITKLENINKRSRL